MTRQATLKHAFLDELGSRVASCGFSTNETTQSFSRLVPGFTHVIHLSFIPHVNDFDLTADVALRNDAIEELTNKYDAKRSAKDRLSSMTIGIELGNLARGSNIRWTIVDESHLQLAADQAFELLQSVEISFFNRYCDLGSLADVLTSSSPADRLLCPLRGPRYMRAISACFLTGDRARFAAVGPIATKELVEHDDLYLPDFERMYRDLSSQIAA